MNKLQISLKIVFVAAAILFSLTFCKKTENPIKFEKGTFPDSIIVLSGLNSAWDDYNLNLYSLNGVLPLIFSSNRESSGGQFDLVQGAVSYMFNQTSGDFSINGEITTDAFRTRLISKLITVRNDFGPYSLYSPVDGFEYTFVSSVNTSGNLDFYYTKNLPVFGNSVPDVTGPFPVSLLNSGSDEAYICFDTNQDSAYFSSNRDGNFDIFLHRKPSEISMESWLSGVYASSSKVDILSSTGDDKCPFIHRKVMVFASNREGGIGGYDLYYSVFGHGQWSAPVNFGPSINTTSDEYRPVLGSNEEFTNIYMMFSSNRPGGKGGYDLYFTGIDFVK
jgi:hypothetical protein